MKKFLLINCILIIMLSGALSAQDHVKLKVLDKAMKCKIIDANDSLIVFQKMNSDQILRAFITDVDWYFFEDGSGINFTDKKVTQADFDNAYEFKPLPPKPAEIIEPPQKEIKSKPRIPITKNPDERISIEMNLRKYFSTYERSIGIFDTTFSNKSTAGPLIFDFNFIFPTSNDVSLNFGGGYYYESWDLGEDIEDKHSGIFLNAGVKIYISKKE